MIKTTRILQRNLLLLSIHLGLVGVVLAGDQQKLQTVPRVELDRYVGTWYEIERLPNWFQDQSAGDVTADYRQLDDGK